MQYCISPSLYNVTCDYLSEIHFLLQPAVNLEIMFSHFSGIMVDNPHVTVAFPIGNAFFSAMIYQRTIVVNLYAFYFHVMAGLVSGES